MRVIGQLAARLLRSRYGIALGLAAIVVGVLATTSLLTHGADGTGPVTSVAPIPTVHPTVGDDGEQAPPSPTVPALPGATPPQKVARDFATAWLSGRTTPAGWQGRLRPYLTADLAGRLADADPASVPATTVTGDARTSPLGSQLAEVTLPTRAGQLRLRLLVDQGRWLVDAVDWEQR